MGGAGADRAAKEASVPDADAEWANLSPQERLEKHKQNIAVACSEVMENPDANIKQLATVLQLCSIKDQDIAPAVGKLAIMSLATVFKDIIPAYRIRAEPEPKPGAQLAKETKKLQVAVVAWSTIADRLSLSLCSLSRADFLDRPRPPDASSRRLT